MKRMILALLLSGAPGAALAQHSGHSQPAPTAAPQPAPAPPPTCAPEHSAMGHCSPPAQAPVAVPTAPAAAPTCSPEHAAMGHCSLPAQAPVAAPTAPTAAPTCSPEHAAMGHCSLAAPSAPPPPAADPHAGHDMSAMESAPPVGPPPQEAFSGPAHAADTAYDPAVMSAAREALRVEHGAGTRGRFTIDQFEVAMRNGRDGYSWEDVQFWYGGDINRLWLKSEGEGTFGEGVEGAEVQALWSRAISPYWDLQAGVRQDFRRGPDRTHLVLGVQGLAPYWFEVDAAAFLSSRGDLTARTEVEYDQRITQRLILQPRIEANFSLQDVPELRLGSGVTSAEAGLRLRYEIVPEFAPYVGVQYERAFGDTADFRRADGEDVGGWSLVLGVRTWF